MEFFIPGLLLFLVAILITFFLVPKATPIVAAILSIIFLAYGVQQHHKLFASEYRLSTWQDGLKVYAPAIMIGAIILYSIISILSFFTGGAVPVPSMPNITIPSANTVTESISQSLNNVSNTISNVTNNVFSLNKAANNKGSSIVGNIGNSISNSLGLNKNRNNNMSRSKFEVV